MLKIPKRPKILFIKKGAVTSISFIFNKRLDILPVVIFKTQFQAIKRNKISKSSIKCLEICIVLSTSNRFR
jgi:hypothetical protein